MTSIDFYFNATDKLQVACRLAGKAASCGTRLLIYAGQLMQRAVPPRRACRVAVSTSLTDDVESQKAIDALVSAIFP